MELDFRKNTVPRGGCRILERGGRSNLLGLDAKRGGGSGGAALVLINIKKPTSWAILDHSTLDPILEPLYVRQISGGSCIDSFFSVDIGAIVLSLKCENIE